MTADEVSQYAGAVSGTVNLTADFDEDNVLKTIVLNKTISTKGEDETVDTVTEVNIETKEAGVDELDSTNATTYYLPTDDNGTVYFSRSAIQNNYENLEFTCEVL